MATITGIVYVVFFSYHVVLVEQTGKTAYFNLAYCTWCFLELIFAAYFAGVVTLERNTNFVLKSVQRKSDY